MADPTGRQKVAFDTATLEVLERFVVDVKGRLPADHPLIHEVVDAVEQYVEKIFAILDK